MHILNVEDEPSLSRKIAEALKLAGHVVSSTDNGLDGLAWARENFVDLVVLDINLPDCDGFTVLDELRKSTECPPRILMLTARGELQDRVGALRAGADDYLTKPFAMEELLARVAALGRRLPTGAPQPMLKIGPLSMEVVERKVRLHEEQIILSPREFSVLHLFMLNPNRIFGRDELCEKIWRREHEYDTRTVEIFIMRLRRKLDDGRGSVLLETIRGVGYRLVATS
jgi:DNA-binding response OmpR family regulator